MLAIALNKKIEIYKTYSPFQHMDPRFIIPSENCDLVQLIWLSDKAFLSVSRTGSFQPYAIESYQISAKDRIHVDLYYIDCSLVNHDYLYIFGLDYGSKPVVLMFKFDLDNLNFELISKPQQPSYFQLLYKQCIKVWSGFPPKTMKKVDLSPNSQLFLTLTTNGRFSLHNSIDGALINSWESSKILQDEDSGEIIIDSYFWTDSIFLFSTSMGSLAFVPLNRIGLEFEPIPQKFSEISITCIPDDRFLL
jgi:hypothetical protein